MACCGALAYVPVVEKWDQTGAMGGIWANEVALFLLQVLYLIPKVQLFLYLCWWHLTIASLILVKFLVWQLLETNVCLSSVDWPGSWGLLEVFVRCPWRGWGLCTWSLALGEPRFLGLVPAWQPHPTSTFRAFACLILGNALLTKSHDQVQMIEVKYMLVFDGRSLKVILKRKGLYTESRLPWWLRR